MNNLSRMDIICLKDLERNEKTSYLRSLGIKEFLAVKNGALKYNSVYRILEKLKDLGLIEYGALNGNAKTYYITSQGLEVLNQL